MFSGLRPYPAYESYGSYRLANVPSAWSVQRLKAVARNVVESSGTQKANGHYIALEHVEGWTGRVRFDDSATFDGAIKRFSAGDVLFGKLRPYLAKIVRACVAGACSSEFFVLRPRNHQVVSSEFLELVLRSVPMIEEISRSTFGARMPRAEWGFVGGVLIALPARGEQSAIARFLTFANARINQAVLMKRKMISLLEEQKEVLVGGAVTGGLDYGTLSDRRERSGLDAAPAHWRVEPFLRSVIERADYRGATPEKVETGAFLVTAKNVRPGWIDYEGSKEYVRREDYDRIMRRGLPKIGDVLLTMEAPLGNVALVDREDIALAQRLVRFRTDRERLRPEFAEMAMNSHYFQAQLAVRTTGSTAQGIKASKLPQLIIALPPVDEQDAIVHSVGSQIQEFDRLATQARRGIELLREFRTRLTADVVTGQLDVREAAAKLPDLESADLASAEIDDSDDVDAVAEEFLDENAP